MATFQAWLLTLVETRRSATGFWPWMLMIAIVLTMLAFAAFVEPIASWFHLDFVTAVICFIPMMILGLGAGWAESNNKLPLTWFGALILLGAAFFQFFWAALVLLSTTPGSFVMASIFMITVILHGYLHRVSKQYPFGLAATCIAVLTALWLWPDAGSRPLLYFCAVTAGLLSLITGGIGLQLHENLVEQDMLKQALYYRELNQKAREHTEMSRRVFDLLKYNHDAGNTLSALFVHAQLLEERFASEDAATPELSHVAARVSTLLTQLQRLKTLITSAHRIADEMPVIEVARVPAVVQDVVRETQALFPQVSIRYTAQPGPFQVRILEGDLGLRRVTENVLRNACEGNGSTCAHNVWVRVSLADAHLSLSISDDGPGFAETQLRAPPTALVTTKAYGHGLGLYSVHELVEASGGSLARTNAAEGGAVVTITLHHAEADQPVLSAPLPPIAKAPAIVGVELANE